MKIIIIIIIITIVKTVERYSLFKCIRESKERLLLAMKDKVLLAEGLNFKDTLVK